MNQPNAIVTRKTRPTAATGRRQRQVLLEALEERRMMSLTITLREAGGGSSAVVTTVGQVINLEILATITSADNMPSEDDIQDVDGNIESTPVDGQAVDGNLAAANLSPFDASGSAPGTQQALVSGDSNIDVGGNDPDNTSGLFFARSDSPEPDSAGTVVGGSVVYEIGTVAYTVTNLAKGGITDINFVVVPSTLPDNAAWYEESQPLNNLTGTFVAGSPFTVSDPSLITGPTAVNETAPSVIRNTPTSINVLSADSYVTPFNTSSVKITTAPSHGTAIPQSDGTVLYTPTMNYIGPDSFSYTVADQNGLVSNVATVSLTVVTPPPPVAGAVSSTTVRGEADTITVLSSDSTTSPATLVATSVTVTTQPAHGSATAQSDGTIIYTPAAGYTGTDSFLYTVSDTNGETSSPGTVSVTVNSPTPPTAVADTGITTEGAPVTLDVLANDTTPQGTLNPASVVVTVQPADGTAAAQADGTIIYTPAADFVGSDSFQYTVDDSFGDPSNAATVSLTVGAGVPPVATTVTSPALTGQSTSINVLSGVSGAAPLNNSSLALATLPANGVATINTSNATISYTPNAGFVGTDSFTYSVSNVNGQASNVATVNVDVGTTISNAKGKAHSLSFTDAAGGVETFSISSGSAELFFTGTDGLVTVSKSSRAAVTGQSLAVTNIELTGTTKASSLSVSGRVKDPINIAGGITYASPLGSISAPSMILGGTVTLNSLGSLNVDSISGADITIASGLPGRTSITTGAVTNSNLSSAVAITSLRAASWSGAGIITAPSIASLTVPGEFDAGLAVTTLPAARVGTVGSSNWNLSSTGAVTVTSFNSGWNGSLGAIRALTVRSGGLPTGLTATAITSLVVTGDVTGTLSAASAKLIRVNGNIDSGSVNITGSLGQLIASETIGDENITVGGNITSLTAGGIDASNISAGVVAGTTFSDVTSSTLGTATISTIRLTGKPADGDEFTASSIIADKITSASLGSVTTNNGGSSFGLAVSTINSFTGIFSGNELRANKTALQSNAILSALLTQDGVSFGDFELEIGV